VERARIELPGETATNSICWYDKFDFAQNFDVSATSFQGQPLGTLLNVVDLSEYDCYASHDVYFPKNGDGAEVTAVKSVVSKPGSLFQLVALYELPSASFQKANYSYTNFTQGEIYTTYYRCVTGRIFNHAFLLPNPTSDTPCCAILTLSMLLPERMP